MSYDIDLTDPVSGDVIIFDESHHMRGGTYQLGGSPEAHLNVTYNYSTHFTAIGPEGVRSIYGKTGAESIPMLDAAIIKLSDDTDDDYWKATEGNAKRALLQLRAFATMRPDGIWRGD